MTQLNGFPEMNADEEEFLEQPVETAFQDPNEDEDVPYETGEDQQETEETNEAEEPAPEPVRESSVMKKMRAALRQTQRELRDARQRIPAPAAPTFEPNPMPELGDYDYDSDAYKEAMKKWAKVEQDRAVASRAVEIAAESENAKIYAEYQRQITALRVKDFPAAQEAVSISFSVPQQNMILNGSENAAKVVYYLAKYPSLADALAEENNPVKFLAKLGKFEAKIQAKPTKSAPTEISPVKRSATSSSPTASAGNSIQKELARLENAASKTGNRTDVLAFKIKHNLF